MKKTFFFLIIVALSFFIISCDLILDSKNEIEIRRINYGYIERTNSLEKPDYRNYKQYQNISLIDEYYFVVDATVLIKKVGSSIAKISLKLKINDTSFMNIKIEEGAVEDTSFENGFSASTSSSITYNDEYKDYLMVFSIVPKSFGDSNASITLESDNVNFVGNVQNEQNFSIRVSKTTLATPEFTIGKTGIIDINPVDHAINYTVTVDDISVTTENISINMYSIKPILAVGDHIIKVKAHNADGRYYSDSLEGTKNYIVSAILDAPVFVISITGIITINEVSNAIKYNVQIDNVSIETTSTIIDIYSIVPTLAGGVHIIKITAIGNNIYYMNSIETSVEYIIKIKLSTPEFIISNSGIIDINPVEHAINYTVTVDDISVTTENISINMYSIKPKLAVGNVSIKVTAIADNIYYTNSDERVKSINAQSFTITCTFPISGVINFQWSAVSCTSFEINLTFYGLNGEVISSKDYVVLYEPSTYTYQKGFAIPEGAVSAEITITPINRNVLLICENFTKNATITI
jgi:hypothetical protein